MRLRNIFMRGSIDPLLCREVEVMMKRAVLSVVYGLGMSFLFGQDQPKVKEHVLANRAFLDWKVHAENSPVSPALKTLLTPDAIAYVVDECVKAFSRPLSEDEIKQKRDEIVSSFLAKYNPQHLTIDSQELSDLLLKIGLPKLIFLPNPDSKNPFEESYADLINRLDNFATPGGSTLGKWALHYLRSESILVALNIIEHTTFEGLNFNLLYPNQQKEVLEPVITIVTTRFLGNLREAQKKYKFELPFGYEEAVKSKIRSFLDQKFVFSV